MLRQQVEKNGTKKRKTERKKFIEQKEIAHK